VQWTVHGERYMYDSAWVSLGLVGVELDPSVLHLTGIDPNTEPLGPPTTQVFAWSNPDKPHVVLE